ncbi:MAG TPA: type II toxin-antitoxin system VapC family toxin [Anaerolineales bacterium]
MTRSASVVIDAGIGVFQVIADPLSHQVDARWSDWIREGVVVCAPRLWLNETTSVLHKIFMQNIISEERALEALEALLGLGVELYEADTESCRQAFAWASRLGQHQAYDGFYLALAVKLSALFWTTDQRLVNRARQLGIDWVNWIGA